MAFATMAIYEQTADRIFPSAGTGTIQCCRSIEYYNHSPSFQYLCELYHRSSTHTFGERQSFVQPLRNSNQGARPAVTLNFRRRLEHGLDFHRCVRFGINTE